MIWKGNEREEAKSLKEYADWYSFNHGLPSRKKVLMEAVPLPKEEWYRIFVV